MTDKFTNFDEEKIVPQIQKTDEFSEQALEMPDLSKMSPINRRKFLALVGASTALAATACTDYRDKGKIISYNKKPEIITYGAANYYASTYRDGSAILIKTREGRPLGVVGNDIHPIAKGKASVQAHSAVLDLYDPERLKSPQKNGKKISWQKVDEEIVSQLASAKNSNTKTAIFCNEIHSPTFAKLLEEIKLAGGNVEIFPISLVSDKNREVSWRNCYGNTAVLAISWDKAKIIVAFEADILGHEGRPIEQIRGYANGRNVDDAKNFNRLYAIESTMSLTGTNADYRMKLNPLNSFEVLAAIYNELVEKVAPMGYSSIGNYSLDSVAKLYNLDRKVLNLLLNDLLNNPGRAIVYAGDALPFYTHNLVNLINQIIGAAELYDYSNSKVSFFEGNNPHRLKQIIKEMNEGKVGTAIVLDANPAYILADDFGFVSALKKVKTKIAFVEKESETSELCEYVLPVNHPFESWGDYQDRAGVVSLVQPVIEPLYDTRQIEAVLLSWLSGNPKAYSYDIYHDYLKKYWATNILPMLSAGDDSEKLWFACLHDGFAEIPAKAEIAKINVENSLLIPKLPNLENPPKGITVLLTNNYFLKDGRYANNGWLQEIPHPVTKAVWDNYAMIAPATADKLGLDYKDFNSDMIEVSIGNRKLKLPIIWQPGMQEDVIAIELGFGRKKAGTIGTDVGFNAVKLMTKNDDISPLILTNANIKKLNEKYKLFSTQEHHKLEDEFVKDFHRIRHIVQDGTLAQFVKNPGFIQQQREMTEKEIDEHSVNPPHDYGEVKWAMAIDLNKCVACSNCVASCNVENNVPVVGKEECGHGREMHWVRIDRYYSGTSEVPIVSSMPMLCQHCDMAPCENVCPVAATTHSIDGLNQMTYNRCVGTRYCANNCPYKVRRFNFFNFRNWVADGFYEQDSLELMHNPEVTVRSRGVMEKCTFCIQRLMEGRQEATKRGEKFLGVGLKTACQEACPADAIVFGNINDPNSEISKLAKHKLGYKVLEIIAVKPNITYLAKLRNINEEEAL